MTISQLIAYLSYEIRMIATINALEGCDMSTVARRHPSKFTLDQLDWDPWIETIEQVGLSDDVLAEVYRQAPNAKGSPTSPRWPRFAGIGRPNRAVLQ